MLENENMIDLLGSLKGMSSERISQLIQEETSKDSPNDDLVLMALDILEDREKENPVQLGTKGTAAWKKYQLKVHSRQRKRILIWKPIMQVASVLVAITLLFAMLPTQANAETWWERLARWSDDFFSFFNPNESEMTEDEYVFQTDDEGLQQIYDAVVELGVTEPIVPMWLPSNYELLDIETETIPGMKKLVTIMRNDDQFFVYQVIVNENARSQQYHKNDNEIKKYERSGTQFFIMQNQDNWVVVWNKENIECSIFIDCQEDTLYGIIDSIYKWRIFDE